MTVKNVATGATFEVDVAQNGEWSLDGLPAGDYELTLSIWSAYGWGFTWQNRGTDETLDSDFDRSISTASVTLTDGEAATHIDAGVLMMSQPPLYPCEVYVRKALTGPAASLVPTNQTFQVTREYTYPGASTPDFYTQDVRVGSSAFFVWDPYHTAYFTEESMPNIPGVAWGTPKFTGNQVTDDGSGRAAVYVENYGAYVYVTLTNTALQGGDFSVEKAVTGDGASLVPSTTEFTVQYSYPAGDGYEAGSGTLTISADGTLKLPASQIPVGAVVTLSESTPPAISGVTWGAPVFSGAGVTSNGDGTYWFTVEYNSTTAITVTNTASLSSAPSPSASSTSPVATPSVTASESTPSATASESTPSATASESTPSATASESTPSATASESTPSATASESTPAATSSSPAATSSTVAASPSGSTPVVTPSESTTAASPSESAASPTVDPSETATEATKNVSPSGATPTLVPSATVTPTNTAVALPKTDGEWAGALAAVAVVLTGIAALVARRRNV